MNARFRKKHPEVILPPDYYIYETYKLNVEEYYYDGQATAAEIVSADLKLPQIFQFPEYPSWIGVAALQGSRDIYRNYCRGPGSYASDYNPEYIEWCKRSIEGIEFSLNKIDPPADHPDASFDAIIGFSILTHLSEANHLKWIDELHRMLKPGGIAYHHHPGKSLSEKNAPGRTRRYLMRGNL